MNKFKTVLYIKKEMILDHVQAIYTLPAREKRDEIPPDELRVVTLRLTEIL